MRDTKGIGRMIKPMAKENSSMSMGIYMTANEKTTRLMAKVSIHTAMVLSILEGGKKTCRMDLESKHGRMDQNMMENMWVERKRGRGRTDGLMAQFMKDNGDKI